MRDCVVSRLPMRTDSKQLFDALAKSDDRIITAYVKKSVKISALNRIVPGN